jgi:peptide/nickel transport system permease protein
MRQVFPLNVPLPAPQSVLRRLAGLRPSLGFGPGFGLFLAALFVLLLVAAAVAPGLLVPGDPLEGAAREAFGAPLQAGHLLGTDENGRDVLVRLVHGARASLSMGVAATLIGVGFGIALGLSAGLGPRWFDTALMRLVDILLAFPDLLLVLVFIAMFGQGLVISCVAVGVASVPRYARLVRAQTRQVRGSSYVEAARTLGWHPLVVVWRHVLPNAVRPILPLAAIGIGGKIALGAALSFLGFGAPPPSPEWGAMLALGRNFLSNAPWLVAIPGITITLTVVSITALGRQLLLWSEGKTV